MPAAQKKYIDMKKKLSKKRGHEVMRPEVLELEKKRLMARLSKSSSGAQELNTEAIYNMIKKRMEKENTENPDLGTRNFMLPSYHQKTFYKAATSLHMQTENSLKAPDH